MTKTANIHQYCNTLASQHRKLMKKYCYFIITIKTKICNAAMQ